MALSFIQDGSSFSNASGSAGQALGAPCGIGTCVVVLIQPHAIGANTVTSVTSGMGTFTRVNSRAGSGSTDELEWWVCLATTASVDTITVATSGSVVWDVAGFEWLGGVSSAATGGGVGPTGTPSVTPTAAVATAVLVGINVGPASILSYPASPWASLSLPLASSTGLSVAQQLASGANPTAAWRLTGGTNAVGLGLVLTPDSPAPSTPTLVSPSNASIFDVSSGVTFTSTYNAAGADAMNAYAMRVKVSGGGYFYWNAGTNALQSSIVWNSDSVVAGQNFNVSLPAAALSDGNVYNWSMACQDAVSGGQGSFATDYTFTAQVSPSVTVTAPTGTVGGTTQPTLQWTATTAPSTIQVTYSIIVESGTYSTTPGSGTLVWASGTVTGGVNTAQIGVPLLTGTSYRAFVMIAQTGGQSSSWGFTTFTISTDVPATPTILAAPSTDPATGCPIIEVLVQALDNYLSAADSSFETGIGTAVGTNCTVAQSGAQHLDGTHSLDMTASSSGTMSVKLGPYAASPGEQVKGFAAFRANSTGRTCTVGLQWQGASGTPTSAGTADTSGGWTQATSGSTPPSGLVVTGTAPAGTTGVFIVLTVQSAGSGEQHFADCAFVGPSTATVWGLGGFVGQTSVVIVRSDNVYVRWASVNNPLPVPSVGQLAEVFDYEAIPGVEYTYTAYVQQASVPLQSAPVTSTQAEVANTFGWWELNPLAGTATSNPSAVNAADDHLDARPDRASHCEPGAQPTPHEYRRQRDDESGLCGHGRDLQRRGVLSVQCARDQPGHRLHLVPLGHHRLGLFPHRAAVRWHVIGHGYDNEEHDPDALGRWLGPPHHGDHCCFAGSPKRLTAPQIHTKEAANYESTRTGRALPRGGHSDVTGGSRSGSGTALSAHADGHPVVGRTGSGRGDPRRARDRPRRGHHGNTGCRACHARASHTSGPAASSRASRASADNGNNDNASGTTRAGSLVQRPGDSPGWFAQP